MWWRWRGVGQGRGSMRDICGTQCVTFVIFVSSMRDICDICGARCVIFLIFVGLGGGACGHGCSCGLGGARGLGGFVSSAGLVGSACGDAVPTHLHVDTKAGNCAKRIRQTTLHRFCNLMFLFVSTLYSAVCLNHLGQCFGSTVDTVYVSGPVFRTLCSQIGQWEEAVRGGPVPVRLEVLVEGQGQGLAPAHPKLQGQRHQRRQNLAHLGLHLLRAVAAPQVGAAAAALKALLLVVEKTRWKRSVGSNVTAQRRRG